MGDLGSIPGLGRSPGEGKGYPLQYSTLENSMDCMDYGVAKSWTQLSDFHTHTHSILSTMQSLIEVTQDSSHREESDKTFTLNLLESYLHLRF